VNRALRRISIAILVMFLLLLININYLQGFEPASLANKPGNSRAFYAAQNSYERGSIVTSDGVTIAASRRSADPNDSIKYQRYYPDGLMYAPITGYDTLYSQTGIEATENSLLSGNDSALTVRNFLDLLTGKPRMGATVTLTINSRAQAAAYDALASFGKPGGVVAIDPKTGAILAMASYPSYDPNTLATHNGVKLNQVDQSLLDNHDQPLLNRALQETSPPGSTFKIVTSAALLTQNPSTNINTSVYSPTTLTLPQTTHVLTNNDGEVCGNGSGQAPLITAFAQSCDTTFGKIGENLGASTLNAMAEKFGMNNPSLTIPLGVAASHYVIPDSQALTAFSAIGQYSDTVTPLQEAMFAAAIANGGTLMRPYLVQQVTASDLSTVQTATPSVLSQPVGSSVASEVGQMMLAVVQDPDGTAAMFNQAAVGVEIAGKTGTAQNGVNNTGLNDAAFTCFAPFSNPSIAVGVIIQGGGYGAVAAAPIAVQVIKAFLRTP
jgi:penicillin-binding protein A